MAKKASRLIRNYSLLKILSRSSPKQRKLIIKRVNPDVISCLCDICHNIIKGNLHLSSKQKINAIRFKKIIRKLADKKKKIESKRKNILQQGGFLPAIIPAAISLAISLLPSLLSK